MKKFLLILAAIFLLLYCVGSMKEETNEYEYTSVPTTFEEEKNVEEEKTNENVYNVIQKVDLYSEPNSESNKLINQKATKELGEVYYLSVDESCTVVVLETKGDWSKIQVKTPSWLVDSHIGWVRTNILALPMNETEYIGKYKENKDYQILYSTDKGTVTNYYVLLLLKTFTEKDLDKLALCIKHDIAKSINCNISIYDSKDIVPLIERYPLEGKDYVKLADHFVYMYSFEGTTSYYPLKDMQYKEYGGKKPLRK